MLASPQYGGNPVSMAIAEATLCVIEDEHLQEHAERVGGFLLAELEALKAKHPQVIGDVRWVVWKGQVLNNIIIIVPCAQ